MLAFILATVLVLVVLLVGAVVAVFNGLISLRNEIRRSWSNIDVLLKQRFDEIPRLVDVCKGYMKHERAVLELITKARARVSEAHEISSQTRAEDGLTDALHHLFAVVEKYPDLKANDSFLKLQHRITELEDQIADRREFYNQCVTAYNTRRESFPDLIVANSFRFEQATWWRVNSARERLNPIV